MSFLTRRGALVVALALALVTLVSARSAASAQGIGDARRGEETFAAKQCAHCHPSAEQKSVGPNVAELRRRQGAYELAGRLWNHAPAMFTVLTHEGLRWPDIEPVEMADLMAYLGADPSLDPTPDLAKGQATLISKGCLKCHTFRGEGARIGPDLAGRPGDYAPPATWAAKMWRHTPRMAATAIERGVLYPRFSGDEMVNLLAFLRGTVAR
jgi:cytochrome c2